jgi:ribosomal protein S24E
MEMKIIAQKKNPFLSREEFVLEVVSEISPTFDEVKIELGKNADLTVVKKVNTNFGRKIFLVDAVVYDNDLARDKIEVIPKKIRKKIEADRKVAEEAAKKTGGDE